MHLHQVYSHWAILYLQWQQSPCSRTNGPLRWIWRSITFGRGSGTLSRSSTCSKSTALLLMVDFCLCIVSSSRRLNFITSQVSDIKLLSGQLGKDMLNDICSQLLVALGSKPTFTSLRSLKFLMFCKSYDGVRNFHIRRYAVVSQVAPDFLTWASRGLI